MHCHYYNSDRIKDGNTVTYAVIVFPAGSCHYRQRLFLGVRVGGSSVLVRFRAVMMGSGSMLLGLIVFAQAVMMSGLMRMMRRSGMMRCSLMMMLGGRMGVRGSHERFSFEWVSCGRSS